MRVVHIAQSHGCYDANFKLTQATFDKVTRSQFAVAQLILQNPHCPVVSESLDRTLTFNEFSNGQTITFGPHEINVKKIKKIFPNGLPDHFDDLNKAQLEAFYCCGAPIILLLLNKITVLYSCTDEITNKMAQNYYNNDLQSAAKNEVLTTSFLQTTSQVMLTREKAAIAATKYAAEAHYKEVEKTSIVILVYGSRHNFQFLCARNGLHYQKIYTHPEQVKEFSTNSSYELGYTSDSPFWISSDICDKSKIDIDKINKHSSWQFSPQKIKISFSLLLIAAGSGLLAMYCLLSIANPLVLLITGTLLVGLGLIFGLYLFMDWLNDRYNPSPATFDVTFEGKEPTTVIHTSSNAGQSSDLDVSSDRWQISPCF